MLRCLKSVDGQCQAALARWSSGLDVTLLAGPKPEELTWRPPPVSPKLARYPPRPFNLRPCPPRLEAVQTELAWSTCRSLPGATEGNPFGEGALVFKVAGKMLAIARDSLISLKCDPTLAVVLREAHPAVTAGYHLDKRHWNSVELDGSLPDDKLRDWIQDSYDLVVASLSRPQRAALTSS